jgi:Hemolysin coregulated protein Hcp (TssD)
MASFAATFSLDGNDYPVLSCTYSFAQGMDSKGQPSTDVQGGTIAMQIASSDDTSIASWMIDPGAKKDGSIVFKKADGDGTLKEVKFEEGYCVGYSESFSSTSSMPMTITLNITCKKLSVGDATHEKKWK